MTFQTTLLGWHDFYSITGMAAASLVGLLFVGLSIHLRVVVSRPDVKSLARVTLTSFALSLFVSIFMVIPESDPAATGWQLISLGAIACLLIVRSLIAGVRSRVRIIEVRRLALRFGLTFLSYVLLITAGGVLVGGNYRTGLGLLVGVAVLILVTTLRNVWDLLVTVGAATLGVQSADTA
jgi:hypothetical protein